MKAQRGAGASGSEWVGLCRAWVGCDQQAGGRGLCHPGHNPSPSSNLLITLEGCDAPMYSSPQH